MANNVSELIDMLYEMVSDAWGLPLGNEKCVIEREKVLDLLDEIKNMLPTELAEAQRLVNARTEYIASAKSEADSIKKAAEDHARRLMDEQEITKAAKQYAMDEVKKAQDASAELRRAAAEYAEDTMKRTEEAINAALEEVRTSRMNFKSSVSENNNG